MTGIGKYTAILSALLLLAAACAGPAATPVPLPTPTPTPPAVAVPVDHGEMDTAFTLETILEGSRLAFRGVGNEVDGVVNPTLRVNSGDLVRITLINSDGVEHDFAIPQLDVHSEHIHAIGARAEVVFTAHQAGEFAYYCTIPGHRQAGMEGKLVVGEEPVIATPDAVSIVRDPADLPGPIGERPPQTVRVELETVELEGRLADGATYTYWTFNGRVPGPFVRVREGDTVEVHLKNRSDSTAVHSIDFHAATGYHGGGSVSQIAPGQEVTFTFKALNPGLYVYHCATPSVAHHIASGMYGLILVEPAEGLAPVDREFYVMQGELYTAEPHGTSGHLGFSHEKMLDERPEYFVYNGAVGALTEESPLRASVGETVRIYYGVGGPSFISSFHVIGEIFDRVYDQGSLTSPPLTNVQTTLVPAGGATVVEFHLELPGSYVLVDHALSRLERGLVGLLLVEGPDNPEVFNPQPGR